MEPDDVMAAYAAGAREQVWHQLRQVGAGVRVDPWLDPATAVCTEMARRARINIESLVERLSAQGYRFHDNDDDRSPATPFFPADVRGTRTVRWLTENVGAMPMTLEAWLREVGDVWLVGSHPDWPGPRVLTPW